MTTTQSPSPDTERATTLLTSEADVDGAEVVKLEKRLAQGGQRELARRLHGRRLELDTTRATKILSGIDGDVDARDMLRLAKRLAGDKSIGLARRLLRKARVDLVRTAFADIYVEIFQKSALYTYKDADLPADWRLDRACKILEEGDDLDGTQDPESLGLAGAIYKRKWEIDSERNHLERALFYYLRGYARGAPEAKRGDVLRYLQDEPDCTLNADRDRGYTGINAAFILDVLASQEEEEAARAGMTAPAAAERRSSARAIREEIIRSVPALLEKPANDWLKEQWWFYATIGEAYFGLGVYEPKHYESAIDWLVERPRLAGLVRRVGAASTGALDIPEWEYESTARQLARLARLQAAPDLSEQEFEASPAGKALARVLQGDHEAVRSAFRGKFGLALSGGGFRASLFHIGVLASLAEHGVLGHVEALSCVSGGSIIGAHYYLELRHLLQTKTDAEITAADYVAIVERLEDTFLTGVKRNIRMRVVAEWTTNLKMIFMPGYSRTLRVGELYERELFRHVDDGEFTGPAWMPDWLAQRRGHSRKRYLNRLYIHPMTPNGTRDKSFQPRNHNWRRINKVPALILNATTLNSGHCWQFTASFMGEPPGRINTEIDANDRLRRMYYDDAPLLHREIRLGYAVAASSCVPGLFEPLILDHLYPDRSARLVDGGVCDNQGVSSLLEQDCTVPLVSDASGQMVSQAVPSSSVVGVPLRTNAILQARVREAQYSELRARRRSRLLQGLMFLHLKKDLVAESVPWIDIPSHRHESDFTARRKPDQDATSYGVSSAIQEKLAAIRTDLDSFNDVEAFALMASGYRMANAQLLSKSPEIRGFAPMLAHGKWKFMAVDRAMQPRSVERDLEAQREHLATILDASASVAFKVWKLSPTLRVAKGALVVAAIVAGAWLLYALRQKPILAEILPNSIARFTFGALGVSIIMALVGYIANRVLGARYGSGVMKAVRWRDTLRSVLIGTALALGGFLIARLHLHVFDKWYLRAGSLQRLLKRA